MATFLSDRDRNHYNFDSSIILGWIVDTIVITRPHVRNLNIADTSSRNWQPSKLRAIICREFMTESFYTRFLDLRSSRGFSSPYNNPIYISCRSRKLRRRRCHRRVCNSQSRLLYVTINALFTVNVKLYSVTVLFALSFIRYSLSLN